MMSKNKKQLVLLSFMSMLVLNGCSGDMSVKEGQPPVPLGREESRQSNYGKLFGSEFLVFGGPKKPGSSGMPSTTVNPFIWRGSLETISFMPLASADAMGGVIVTDWYTAPQSPQERIKVTVYVTNAQLRADAVKVTIYKQVNKGGNWVNTTADPAAATEMENIILSKARKLRMISIEANK